MAYGYIVSWIKLDVHYAGVRYSAKCDPSDLWIKYFTSSLVVKQMREYSGEPDELIIVSTFDSASQALTWEHLFLTLIGASPSSRWLNQHSHTDKYYRKGPVPEVHKQKLSKLFKGVPRPKAVMLKVAETKSKRTYKVNFKGQKHNLETIKRMSDIKKGNTFSKRKPVVANFIEYPSIIAATNSLGVAKGTVRDRILKNIPGYYYQS